MEMLGNFGNWLSSPAAKGASELAGLGATGLGLAGNLSLDHARSQAAAQAKANANLSPQQLGAMVTQATQPLDRQLVQAVTGNVNANLAEQGLSEAPGLIAQAVGQGLAPYEQQNQQTAMQLVLRKLGLPAEFAATIPPNANMSQLLALLMKGANIPGQPTYTPPFAPGGGAQYPKPGGTDGYGDIPLPDPFSTTGDYNFGDLTPPTA